MPGFVLELQPPAQPHRCIAVECPVRLSDGAYSKVVRPQAFREITRLTHGAYCRFDPGAAHQLAELLRAAAAYAAGGVKALAAVQHSAGAARLLLQLR